MKTEQEIKEWIETHNLQTSTINAIRGFIHGAKLNISDVFPCETADYVGKSDTFEDFIEWFNSKPKKEYENNILGDAIEDAMDSFMYGVRESKLEAYVEEKCPFQVGQWVRNKENNKVFQVDAVFNSIDGWVIRECPYLFHFAERLEEYVPKDGEFYISEVKYCFISCGIYSIRLSGNPYSLCNERIPLEHEENIRPATQEEKQLLIKAVEEEYRKTWDEEKKEWVDIPNKFKKGDYAVVVCKDSGFTFSGSMDYLVGKTIKIQSVRRGGGYIMEADKITNNPWMFNPSSLRPATEIEILQYQAQEPQKESITEDIITIYKHPQFGFTVTKGENKAEQIRYDEMLGLVSALTMPEQRPDFAVDWKG